MTSFNFKKQLELGERGESLFMEKYPKKLIIYPGREYDFIESHSKKKIELKTDSYNINKTPNFFFERYSSINKKSPGGPWRAVIDHVDIFCYMFVRHNVWYQFNNIPELVNRLETLTAHTGLCYVKNQGWVTGGYKIPRTEVEDLYTMWEFNND